MFKYCCKCVLYNRTYTSDIHEYCTCVLSASGEGPILGRPEGGVPHRQREDVASVSLLHGRYQMAGYSFLCVP